MTAIVATVMTATVTLPAIAALSDDGGSAVDVGVTEVNVIAGMSALVEARAQIGSLSMLIRTGQLESNVTTTKLIKSEAPLLTQSSI